MAFLIFLKSLCVHLHDVHDCSRTDTLSLYTNALCICLYYSKRGSADVYRVIFILFHEACMDRPISIPPFIKKLINVCFYI